jgi:hypothetical protein
VGHLNGTCDTGAETDAVVGARYVVVHGLGDRDDSDPLLVEPGGVGEGVVSADGDERVHTEPIQVGEHLSGEIVHFVGVAILEMLGHVGQRQMAGTSARGMKKRTAGAADLVDHFLGELDDLLVRRHHAVAHQLHESRPSPADPQDPIAFAKRPDRQRADGRVQSRHVAAAGEDRDRSFSSAHVWVGLSKLGDPL